MKAENEEKTNGLPENAYRALKEGELMLIIRRRESFKVLLLLDFGEECLVMLEYIKINFEK